MSGSDPPIELLPVRTRAERRRFVRFPWRIYRADPLWVPPLEVERMAFFDRRENPFFRHSDAELFLARRGGEWVGRIAAIENRRHLATYGDATGFFGCFEAIDDVAVARALLERALAWVRERGLRRLRGPMSFTINDECGLLVEGFDRPPVLLMAYNPPYYERLLEACGCVRVQDLYAYRMDVPAEVPARVANVAAAVAARGIAIRPLDFRRFEAEVERVHRIHSRAWAENWGAVPLTVEEMRALARELKPLADRDLVFLAEDGGDPVGVAVTVPDIHQALARARGRLLPVGWLRLLLARRRIDAVRVLILGVLPGKRLRGVDAALYAHTMAAAARKGYRWGELSWVLESNGAMNRAAERLGAVRYKTYRIYDLEP